MKANGSIDPKFIVQIQGKDFVRYDGLLELGHRIGIKRLGTKVVHIDQHGIICKATLELEDGRIFKDIGDACQENCNEKVVKHWIRIASTRAKARVLRDATNIGMVAVEELD